MSDIRLAHWPLNTHAPIVHLYHQLVSQYIQQISTAIKILELLSIWASKQLGLFEYKTVEFTYLFFWSGWKVFVVLTFLSVLLHFAIVPCWSALNINHLFLCLLSHERRLLRNSWTKLLFMIFHFYVVGSFRFCDCGCLNLKQKWIN